jgi:arginase
VRTNSAGTTDGVARAPEALRRAGIIEALEATASVVDHGDVVPPPPSPVRDPVTGVIDPGGLRTMVKEVRERVAEILAEGRFPLVLGGDCPILLGCLGALGGPADRGLLFVDGHEDAYPPELSTTGEAADMELGFALGLVDAPWWPELGADGSLVSTERAWLLGPRDRSAIEGYGSRSLVGRVGIDDAATLRGDPAGVTTAALGSVAGSPWWLHLDLDVLSTDALPAVDYRQDGGLSWAELDQVIATALDAGPVGWDVTIYNPDLDPEGVHAERIVRFVGDVIAGVRSEG